VLERIESRAGAGADVAELVERSRAGDALAFAELYVRFFDRVYRYLLVALKNPDDAQEVAHRPSACGRYLGWPLGHRVASLSARRLGRQLGAVAHVELGVDVRQVCLDRPA
jgi:hypothetical protein